VAGDDLTSIPGLLDRHRRALESRMQITTYDALVQANPRTILAAMSRIRLPRPTLEEIRGWQNEARRLRDAADLKNAPAWSRTASFVLSFEQRAARGQVERRLVAQQTELEPEQEKPPATWPGWDCTGICDWLRQKTGVPDSGPEAPGRGPMPDAVELQAVAPAAAPPLRLQFENVAIVDVSGQVPAVRKGQLVAEALECTLPARLEVQVSRSAPDRAVRVALRFRQPAGPGWSPREPTRLPGTGPAQLDLAGIPPGQYQARLVAWAPDGSAEPIALNLGALRIRDAPG